MSIGDVPEVADRVLEGFLSKLPGVGNSVQAVHLGSDFISGLLDRFAGQTVLAAVENDLASLTADQTLLGFAGATLWVGCHWCTDAVA